MCIRDRCRPIHHVRKKRRRRSGVVSCYYKYGLDMPQHNMIILSWVIRSCQHVSTSNSWRRSIGDDHTSKPGSRIHARGGFHTQVWHHIYGVHGWSAPRCFSFFFIVYFHKVNQFGEYMAMGNTTILGQWYRMNHCYTYSLTITVIDHLSMSSLNEHT